MENQQRKKNKSKNREELYKNRENIETKALRVKNDTKLTNRIRNKLKIIVKFYHNYCLIFNME